MAGHLARMQEDRSGFKMFMIMVNLIEKRALGISGRTNARMDLKEIGVNTRKWVDLAQDRDYRKPW